VINVGSHLSFERCSVHYPVHHYESFNKGGGRFNGTSTVVTGKLVKIQHGAATVSGE
jgi:hypothetical protein